MWLANGAQGLIGKLPVHPVKRYPEGDVHLIDGLTFHYQGQPEGGDPVIGYGIVAPEVTARYHITAHDWPGIGYTFQIDPDGTLYQFWPIETVTYHADGPANTICPGVGWHNVHTRGVLLTGFGIEGEPTEAQINVAAKLISEMRWLLSRKIRVYAHKDLTATDCPGNKSDMWMPKIEARAVNDKDVQAELARLWEIQAITEEHVIKLLKELAESQRGEIAKIKRKLGLE